MRPGAETLSLFEEEESYPPEPEALDVGKGFGPRLILPPPGNATLAEAQEALRAGVEGGTTCLGCGQHAQVYRRRLNSGMAFALVLLAKEKQAQPQEAYHVRSLLLRHGFHTGDYCYLVHWNAISRRKPKGEECYPAGYFRLTSKGFAFALGQKELPAAVYLYGEQVLGFEAKRVGVERALGSRQRHGAFHEALEQLRAGGAA
jgi:hypothetical protein